jgi:hypothetical protein
MGEPPGNRPAVPRDWSRGVPGRYVAGADSRGRTEGRQYPWLEQVIQEISGLTKTEELIGPRRIRSVRKKDGSEGNITRNFVLGNGQLYAARRRAENQCTFSS